MEIGFLAKILLPRRPQNNYDFIPVSVQDKSPVPLEVL